MPRHVPNPVTHSTGNGRGKNGRQDTGHRIVTLCRPQTTPLVPFTLSPDQVEAALNELSWRSVEEKYVEDGRLPLPGVLWLLGTLRTTEQVIPSDDQVWEWAGSGVSPCHLPHEWRRVLRNRRRRLALLLRSAAELEEVKYGR